jgi:hypothetical protein
LSVLLPLLLLFMRLIIDVIFSAATFACLIACWAVGGQGFPVLGSITDAQSPIAKTLEYPLICRYLISVILSALS